MSRLLKDYENQITNPYNKKTHQGIDLVGYKSKTCWIKVHSDGKVVGLRTNYKTNDKKGNSYGNYVKIRHDDGCYTLYAHLKYDTIKVKLNQKVKEGDILGYMGNTGYSFGAHLHFEVRNVEDEKIDPTPYLDVDLPNDKTWTKGEYRLLESKAIRTEHNLGNNIVKVKNCREDIKPLLTSKKPNDNAMFKAGIVRDITDIYIDSESRVWGKLTNTWIVLCNKDGTPQAIHL